MLLFPARSGQAAWRNPHRAPAAGGERAVRGGPADFHPAPPEDDRL